MASAFGTSDAMAATWAVAFNLDDWQRWESACTALLSPSEYERVARQRREADRRMLRLAYALHRLALGWRHGIAPAEVPLSRDPQGCPLAGLKGVTTSLSHASGRVAVAASTRGAVGIDLEAADKASAMPEIARSVCTPAELRAIARAATGRQPIELLELWVRKEALLKAAGIGLALPMDSIDVPVATWLHLPDADTQARVRMLDVLPATVMAIAATDPGDCQAAWLRPVPAPACVDIRHAAGFQQDGTDGISVAHEGAPCGRGGHEWPEREDRQRGLNPGRLPLGALHA